MRTESSMERDPCTVQCIGVNKIKGEETLLTTTVSTRDNEQGSRVRNSVKNVSRSLPTIPKHFLSKTLWKRDLHSKEI